MECCVASVGSCQRFGTACLSHFKRSSSPSSILLGLLSRRKLRKIPEERRRQLHRGGSLKSRRRLYKCIVPIIKFYFSKMWDTVSLSRSIFLKSFTSFTHTRKYAYILQGFCGNSDLVILEEGTNTVSRKARNQLTSNAAE
jgi:hypothetical protein